MSGTAPILLCLLDRRLDERARSWIAAAREEIGRGVEDAHFAGLLSSASRHVRRAGLAPSAEERAECGRALEGWESERWDVLDAARSSLVLARTDLAADSAARAIEEAFRFADEGELVALQRSLAHLPRAERFVWRAGEGCRSSMRSVFEAAALDTPFPARFFDPPAFRQAAIKSLFVEAPLWRLWGLDERLDPELARMALDLADERRSAHRAIRPELWRCLGAHAGERGGDEIEREIARTNPERAGRIAAGWALARAGAGERLRAHLALESDPHVVSGWRAATLRAPTQRDWASLEGPS
jgi:hypothetical protein